MSPPLSLWQEFALAALGTLSLLYVLVFRVWTAEALGADLVFALAVAAAVATVAVPSLFDAGARQVVAFSPLPSALEEADARALALADLPGRLIDSALARLGFDSDEDDGTGATDDTSTGIIASESADMATDAAFGPLSAHIRPSVEGLVALLLRVAAGAITMLTLALAILLRAVRGLARRLRRTRDRLDRLEVALVTTDSETVRMAAPVVKGGAPRTSCDAPKKGPTADA